MLMTNSETGYAQLLEKYPEIYFFLSYTEYKPSDRQEGCPDSFEESQRWIASLDLEGIEILYVYGVGRGYSFSLLLSWLEKEFQRRVIFLEDDLDAIHRLLTIERSKEILSHPQVVLRYVKNWKIDLDELAESYPCAHVAVTALPFYAKKNKHKFSMARMALLRSTSVYHALFSEAIFSHKLFKNLSSNLLRLPSAFYVNRLAGRYSGMPAIICGAGPSLKSAIATLKTLDTKAVILAGGSTIAALSNRGVLPHLAMAFDPNEEEYERLHASSSFEVPLLFGGRLLPSIFLTCNGPIGYLKSDTGGIFESWMEQQLGMSGEAIGPDLGSEAFSVTTLAVALAVEMGCSPIIFCGVDLAYTNKMRYAEGVMTENAIDQHNLQKDKRAADRLLKRKDQKGNTVYTLVKWVMESECIGAYARARPDRLFLNATEGGLGFPGIPYTPLEQIVDKHCKCSFDIRGKIHSDIQDTQLELSSSAIHTHYAVLRNSLRRCQTICSEILDEVKSLTTPFATPLMSVLEFDLEQEIAYEILLALADSALQRFFLRSLPPTDKGKLEQIQGRWHSLKEMIEVELKILDSDAIYF